MDLFRFFQPLSPNFFQHDEDYSERLPCSALAPFVRCFWGTASARPRWSDGGLVIPDTCMDLIFEINYTTNAIRSRFCALDDSAYRTEPFHSGDLCATFCIRFYAWSAICFAEDTLSNSMRTVSDPMRFFPRLCRAMEAILFELPSLSSRTQFAECVLMKTLKPDRMKPDALNALYAMITQRGGIRTRDIAASVCLSERQLERTLRAATGASPKLLSNLIRHQLVYRELAENRFDPMDAVAHYGYADQSHLIRDFRRFHTMTPSEALKRIHTR